MLAFSVILWLSVFICIVRLLDQTIFDFLLEYSMDAQLIY